LLVPKVHLLLLAMPSDFITTIDSDDEFPTFAEGSKSKNVTHVEKDEFDAEFEFDFGAGGKDTGLNAWETEQAGEVSKVRATYSCYH
jgi:hypothetical protein